jgi:hypothetical protein
MGELERKNVIVVGAGASAEFGLPTGVTLKKQIANFCAYVKKAPDSWGYQNGDFAELVDYLVHYGEIPGADIGRQRENVRQAAIAISNNMNLAPSIDNFMDTHRSHKALVDIGKVAIAKLISDAERSSRLWVNRRNGEPNDPRFESTSSTWIGRFFGILVAERDFDSFIRALENVIFVSFNYDRCIEQFFLTASASYFKSLDRKMDAADLARVEDALEVIHPYGSLGGLNYSVPTNSGFGRKFRGNDLRELISISSGIQTFTEGELSSKIKPTILYGLQDCDLLIFLGFAFHPLNMKFLVPENDRLSIKRVLATGKGLSKESQHMVREELAAVFARSEEQSISIVDGNCSDLFHEHNRYLSGQVHYIAPFRD